MDKSVKHISDILGKPESEIMSWIDKVKDARYKMFDRSKVELGFQLGDLVFDKKNREVGFVVGEIDPYSASKEHQGKQLFFGEYKTQENTVILVVTMYIEEKKRDLLPPLSINDPDYNSWVTEKEQSEETKFRIRYSKKNDLELIELPEEKQEKTDLEIFCESQCILDCGPDCVFWKYKKKK